MKYFRLVSLFCLLLIIGIPLMSQDVQWRGPDRNGIYPDTGLLQEWPDGGPELLLLKEGLPGGYSTPVIYDDRIYITGRRDTIELISSLTMSGKVLWETEYGLAWIESFPETRNSPVIEDFRIYITGAKGNVACIDAVTGDIIWSVNTHEEYNAGFHRWGMAESLLLTDVAVISSPVGKETVLVALDKKDGSLLWKTDPVGDVRSYASPLMINHNGQDLIIATSSKHLIGVDPENGKIFWKFDLVTDYTKRGRRNSTNTPLYNDGEIFVSSGYDDTALMISLSDDARSVTLKWTSNVLDNHHGGFVLLDGYIYGSNWINNGNGNWVCLDWETGEVMYKEKWKNKGSIIYADGRLYLYEEKRGNVGLLEPTPDGFNVISSFIVEVGKGPHWAHPSIYNGKLLLRHHDALLVFNIKEKGKSQKNLTKEML